MIKTLDPLTPLFSKKMGKLFEKMVGEYREKSEEFWDDVLKGEKILSDKEAKSMLDTVTKLRKDMGFRR